MNVAFVADKDFFPYTQVTIRTLLDNMKKTDKLTIWIIKTEKYEVSNKYLSHLTETYGVTVNCINHEIKNQDFFYLPLHISQAALAKFDIVELLPESINKVLYLDGDLFIQGDLTELYNETLGCNFIAAVKDYSETHAANINKTTEEYFNSGVMLLNLKEMRRVNFREKAIKYLGSDENPRKTSDQDAFNVVSGSKYKLLNDEWNYTFHSKDAHNIQLTDAKVVHFTSYDKPWSIFYNGPLKNEYKNIMKEYTTVSIQDILEGLPVFIWTASNGAKHITDILLKENYDNIIGYIDTYNYGGEFLGKPVYSPKILEERNLYRVIIGSATFGLEIMEYLRKLNYQSIAYSRRIWEYKED